MSWKLCMREIMDTASILSTGQTVHRTQKEDGHTAHMSKNRIADLPSSMHPRATGPRLQALLKALKMTSVAVARSISCDPSAFNKYVRAQRALPDHIAHSLAERHGVTMDFLFRGRLDGISDEDLRERLWHHLRDL